jgi:hypothetical protein
MTSTIAAGPTPRPVRSAAMPEPGPGSDREQVDRAVLVAAPADQHEVAYPTAALDLYRGPVVELLRARVAATPAWRRRTRLLSARHGLVHPDQLLTCYRRRLSVQAAQDMRGDLTRDMQRDWLAQGMWPREVLLIASPLWLLALADMLAWQEPPRIHWYTGSSEDLPAIAAVLDAWGWIQATPADAAASCGGRR